jgi:hypothetical protein
MVYARYGTGSDALIPGWYRALFNILAEEIVNSTCPMT